METTISLKGTGTRIKTELDPPLLGDYKIALQNLSTYYSWSNITSDNIELKYTKGDVQKTITVPKGAYGIKDIALFEGAELERKGDDKASLLGGNSNTLKVHIDVKSTDWLILETLRLRAILVGLREICPRVPTAPIKNST